MESDYRLRQDIDKIRESSDKIDIIENQLESLDTIIDTKLEEYYNIDEIDEKINDIEQGDIDLDGYVTDEELSTALSSYTTIEYANTNYSDIEHTHPNYVDRSELSDLDIELTSLDLVDFETNPNGVMCFTEKSRKEYNIEIDMIPLDSGCLKITANLIQTLEDNNNGTSS